MRQYSIDKVEATWASLDFKEGLAAGTSITDARQSPAWSQKATGLGKVVRVYNPDESGELTITVDQESKLHQQLIAIHATDKQARNQVFPFMITDKSSGEVVIFTNAYIMTEPDFSRGTESATFPWSFLYEKRTLIPNPGDLNVVGD